MISLDEIRSGLKNGEFFLEYLPTISLENHCCIGAEALIRWRRPTGVLLPESFIPLVDNTPLSGLITYWVIETVAEELGEWLRTNDDIHLGINVPPEVLGRGGLEYAAEKSGLMDVLDKLVIEVTERGVPDKQGVDAIKDAARARVRVALDDVGVEDANLVLLSRVKVDIIKIDKSFARQMLTEDWSPDRIQGLSALIHATGHTIIVEGVESEFQVDILKEAGIKVVQGWYFSPSLPAKQFEAFFYQNQQMKTTNSTDATRWHRFPNAQALARAAAEVALEAAREAIAAGDEFRIVLAGGRTPELTYRMLAEAEADWPRWRIYFGDERCLPAEDPERNSQMARSAWLERVAIPPGNVFPIQAELGAEAAAGRYAELVRDALPFDLVLLGMGEDGHTASLFPGHAHAPAELVHAVHQAPKPPPERVSLSAAALGNAHRILILVSGAGKREAVRRWRSGEALPVAGIRGPAGVDVLIDRDAEG